MPTHASQQRVASQSPSSTLVGHAGNGKRSSSRLRDVPTASTREEMDTPPGLFGRVSTTPSANALEREKSYDRDPFCVNFVHNDPQNPRALPQWRKWMIAVVALAIEAWANTISSAAAPAIISMSEDLHVATPAGRVIQAIFLYGFALGAIVWTPLSEDYGRKPTHIIAVGFMALMQIPCALAPNYAFLVVFRFVAGFFAASCFNSVGIISDMWEPEQQSWPVNGFALSAEIGAELGPVIGAFIVIRLGWRWVFGIMGLGSAFLLALYVVLCPETRSGVILRRRAVQKRKETGDERFFAAHERALQNRSMYDILQVTLLRPVYMLFREPIVFFFALFDGWNYAIIYLALESIPLVYEQWGFTPATENLPFLAMLTGCFVAFGLYYFQLRAEDRAAKRNNGEKPPESRLYWMIPGGVIFPASLFWFAWTSQGPPVPWIVSALALGAFGMSSHIIFISVSDYTIAAYSIYAASAVGAQSLLREILSGSVTLFAHQMYTGLGYQWASSLLAFFALLLGIVPPILYWYGPRIRAASAFALEIQKAEADAKREAAYAKRDFDREQTQHQEKVELNLANQIGEQDDLERGRKPGAAHAPSPEHDQEEDTAAPTPTDEQQPDLERQQAPASKDAGV